jgi:myo-inositol-1(or 4)-monophosphatase
MIQFAPMNNQAILHTAVAIAQQTGAMLREALGSAKQIERKSSEIDLVTQYDLAAEELIANGLRAAFPTHGLMAEEGGATAADSGYVWHIDPIDGTNNFAHGIPFFAVSMALYRENEPVVGLVYEPMRDECFTAVAGEGAHLLHNGRKTALRVTMAERLVDSILATGFPYDRHTSELDNMRQLSAFLKQVQGVRRMGSAALDLAYVAAGRLDGYWEFKLNSWDVAAGVLLVQEAGGRVTMMDGRPFSLASKLSLVASNGRIHQDMLTTLANAD